MMIGFALAQGSVSFVPIETTATGDSYSVLDDGLNITFSGTGGQFAGLSMSIPKAALATQPVAYDAPVLSGDGTPQVDETLSIQPVSLWFFDAAQGAPQIDYVTNGANAVSGLNLLLDPADAGADITVTERATYDGSNFGTAVSNVISVEQVSAPAPTPPGTFGLGDFALSDNADLTFDLTITGLPDDGGAALSVVQFSTDAGQTWSDVPGYAGLGTYEISTGSDEASLVVGVYDVTLRALNGLGAGQGSAARSVGLTDGTGAAASLNVTEVDGQIDIDTSDPADITITITGNAAYNGTYVVSRTALAGGPVNLVPAAISYTDADETELTHVAGLWISDEVETSLEINWQSNGSDILNANTPNLILSPSDAGNTLRLRETLTDANGARTAVSNGIAIPGGGLVFETDFGTAFDPLSTSADWESAELVSGRVISDGTAARPGTNGTQERLLTALSLPQAQFTEWRFETIGSSASAQYRHVFRSTRAGRYLFVRHTGGTLNDLRIQVAGGGTFRLGGTIGRSIQLGALYRAEVTAGGEVTLSEDGVAFFTTTLSAGDNHTGDAAGMDFRPTGQAQNHRINYFRAGELS